MNYAGLPDGFKFGFVSKHEYNLTLRVEGVDLLAGDHITFGTKGGTCVEAGCILEVDKCAVLPLRVEHVTEGGDKRIERFHPKEFKYFKKEVR